MTFANYTGRHYGSGHGKLWTRDLVERQLRVAAEQIGRPVPANDHTYHRLKGRGEHLDWPPYERIREYFGSLGEAWLAIGVPLYEIHWPCRPWTKDEDGYLLEWAGERSLTTIARHLGRTYGAVRMRLGSKGFGIRARWNQGTLSAAQISELHGCSYHRVLAMINDGTIPSRKHHIRNERIVDPDDITPAIEARLKAPRQTHWRKPLKPGEWRKANGVSRTVIDRKLIHVAPDGQEYVPINRPWTEAEDWYLITHSRDPFPQQASALCRTLSALRSRRSKLIAQGRVVPMRRKKPSIEDSLKAAGIERVVSFKEDRVA